MDHVRDIAVGFANLFLPGMVAVLITAGPAAVFLRYSEAPKRESTVLVIGLAFCGYVIGVISGASRSPVVSTLLTGLLGVLTGLVAYAHAKETMKSAGIRTLASVSLIALLASILLGLTVGSSYRKRFEVYDKMQERRAVYFKQFAVPICFEQWKHQVAGRNVTTDACSVAMDMLGANQP